jgi:hypothetical protein
MLDIGAFIKTIRFCGRQTMRKIAFGFAAAVLATTPVITPTWAHHSFAMFDQDKVLYLTGTVKEFELVNPHAWLQLVVSDSKSEAATWAFEGGSVSQLVRLGWSKENLKAGDQVEVGYRPMKDGSRGGQLMSVKQANGQKVCSNRGCGDGTGEVIGPQ